VPPKRKPLTQEEVDRFMTFIHDGFSPRYAMSFVNQYNVESLLLELKDRWPDVHAEMKLFRLKVSKEKLGKFHHSKLNMEIKQIGK
jgi:hypothetical protein